VAGPVAVAVVAAVALAVAEAVAAEAVAGAEAVEGVTEIAVIVAAVVVAGNCVIIDVEWIPVGEAQCASPIFFVVPIDLKAKPDTTHVLGTSRRKPVALSSARRLRRLRTGSTTTRQ